jgi:hypothetical protein
MSATERLYIYAEAQCIILFWPYIYSTLTDT